MRLDDAARPDRLRASSDRLARLCSRHRGRRADRRAARRGCRRARAGPPAHAGHHWSRPARRDGPDPHPRHRRGGSVDVRWRLCGRRLRPRSQGAVPRSGLRRRASVDQLHRRGRLPRERVLRAAGSVDPRHVDHGVSAGSHQHLRGPRAAVDPGVPARHVAKGRHSEQRGGAQVLPDGRVRHGSVPVRDVVGVRRVGLDIAERRERSGQRWSRDHGADHARHRVHRRRFRLQGVGGPVPPVGPGHLPGSTHAHHGVLVGLVEDRRFRGPHAAGLRRPVRPRRRVGAAVLGDPRA